MKDGIDMKYEWKVVTDEERAKLDAAVLEGMAQIYADYAELGITNAEEISMMNGRPEPVRIDPQRVGAHRFINEPECLCGLLSLGALMTKIHGPEHKTANSLSMA